MNAPGYTDTFYSRTGTCGRYQPLHFSLDADVAVVGGGLAGVNTAYSLAKRGKRVVLLEGGRIGWAASGRNGGFAHPGFSLGMGDMVAAVGESHTRALWQLSFDSLKTIRGRVKRWAADGRTAVSASVQPGMLTASWFDDPAGAATEVEAGNRLLRRDYFQLWDRQRVRQACATDRYYEGVFDPDSFHFHSLDYAQEVARDAVEAGASIFERSPVSHISLARDGRKVVHTAGGSTVSAPDIVVAGSAYMPALTGAGVDRVRRAVLPVMTYACVTEPLGAEGLAQVLRTPHAITDSRFACDYYRPLPDTRLLWGGRVDCLGIAPEKLAAVLHGDMCKVYPQLRSARVQVAWSGVMGYAAHKMPLIGRLPESEVPGVWYCTGFGGHGVCPTTIAGEVIARAIADGDSTYQLFKPFGLRWAGGPYLGAMAAQGFYWAYELRDWARELRTNKRAPLAAL